MTTPKAVAASGNGFSIELDLNEIDLAKVPQFAGTALEAIIRDVRENDGNWQAKHHSHHSYSTHGTAMW